MRRTDVGDERVARRAADALADRSMKRAATSQDTDEAGEDGLGEFREAIAEGREQLSLAESVAQRTGKDLRDRGRRLRHALDDPDGQCGRAEADNQIDR